jgi:hypothetical protein
MEERTVVACPACKAFWFLDGEPAGCTEADHEHRRVQVHRHREILVLPDGTEVGAVSFDPADPYTRDEPTGFGLYLDTRWAPPWPHGHVDWPDFGVPADPAPVVDVLRDLLDRARAGARVEIGCLGGHGRTGTALAGLAVLCGLPPDDAVAWVRREYCERAVETDQQAAFVAALTD